jgi:hypothetical protein
LLCAIWRLGSVKILSKNFEDHLVERKTVKDEKDWKKSAVAFANPVPAVLYIGIRNNSEVDIPQANLDGIQKKFRWAGIRKASQPATGSTPAKRTMSAAARKGISLVQKARWAKLKGQAAASKPKRHISAAGNKENCGGCACSLGAQFRAAKK